MIVLSCLVYWRLTERVLAMWVGSVLQQELDHVLTAEGCSLWEKRGTFCIAVFVQMATYLNIGKVLL